MKIFMIVEGKANLQAQVDELNRLTGDGWDLEKAYENGKFLLSRTKPVSSFEGRGKKV